MARWPNRSFLWALALCLFGTASLHAQPNWRSFNRDADGLAARSATYLSIGAGGSLWIRHDEEPFITRFDGYSAKWIPAPASDAVTSFGKYRIYEGESGQLWTLNTNGVQWYDGRLWRASVVPEIEAEWTSQILRKVRPIPLLPAGRYNVLVLVSDRLLQFDALASRSTVLKEAAALGLGRLGEMLPANAGGLWVTAEDGIARAQGTTNQTGAAKSVISPDAAWTTYRIPDAINAHKPQRPVEKEAGSLLMLAEARTGDGRVWLRFNDGNWTIEPLPVERTRSVRQAWHTRDGRAWALEVNALRQWQPPAVETREMSDVGIRPSTLSDTVAEASGAYWLSTPDGVWRYAPYSWRAPENAPAITEAISDIFEATDRSLWFLGAENLFRLQGPNWVAFPRPGLTETATGDPSPLGEFADGRIFFTDRRQLIVYEPVQGRFEPLPHPAGAGVRYLGTGAINHYFAEFRDAATEPQLVTFNGQDWTQPELPQPPTGIGAWNCILMSSVGELWLGGSTGVAQHSAGTWNQFPTGNKLNPAGVSVLHKQNPSAIWAGSPSGVIKFNGQSWETPSTSLGRVNGLFTTTNGMIWAATESGLHRHYQGQWIAYGAEEGIAGDAKALRQSGDGRLWLGHSRGLSLFHPETDTEPPQTILGDTPQNKQVSGREVLSFAFSGRDRWKATTTERLLYQYRLDKGEWSPPTTDSTLRLAANELPVGEHELQVRALDRHFNHDPTPAFWPFVVVMPWYLQPQLAGIVILAALAVFAFGALAVNRHLRLVRSYAEVERIVAERTRQLEAANQELAHSEKMRSLGTLAAGVAHDFNSILSIIRGSIQIIEANPDNADKIRTRISRIKSMVEQGSTLVKAMLGFSRADDVKLSLENVGGVVEDTVRLLGDRLPPEVEVTVDVTPGLPPVHGTRELLQQILLNLMLNALDAMESRGRLVLSCQRIHHLPEHWVIAPAHSSEYVMVAVEDSGSGISPENLTRIFEPFFTTKAFSTRHGTGLGLSMVYEFCKELGYGLNVRSELTKGTAFNVVIPVFEDAPAAPRAPAVSAD